MAEVVAHLPEKLDADRCDCCVEGLVAALLYFVLKHHVSAGETSAVCFEGV